MQKRGRTAPHTVEEWEKVKKDYLTTKAPMRELSRKYGIAVSTISDRAKKEGWVRIVEQINEQTEQKIIEQMSDAQADNAGTAMRIINQLMLKLEKSIAIVPDGDVTALKQCVSALKDLREMGVYDVESGSKNIAVTFAEGEDYAD